MKCLVDKKLMLTSMSDKIIKHKVQFQPKGKVVEVGRNTTIMDAIQRTGFTVNSLCGRKGTCGYCAEMIEPCSMLPTLADKKHISDEDLKRGVRLACQNKVKSDIVVSIPESFRASEYNILVGELEKSIHLKSNIKKFYIEMEKPSLEDQRSDAERVRNSLGEKGLQVYLPLEFIRVLPERLRSHEFKFTLVIAGNRVIGIENGDTTGRMYGIAFDIGTITVVGTLMDLQTGKELSHASRMNTQVVFGEDIISRIKYAKENRDGLSKLHGRATGVLREIVREAAGKADVKTRDIYEAVVVGNTTMNHIFLRLSPDYLATMPFVTVMNDPMDIPSRLVRLGINPRGRVYTLPNIAGFVGADTVGVMLGLDFLKRDGNFLAVDIGTNGEIALKTGNRLVCCSTAAGPALEGAQLSCGMRASTGAVERVFIKNGELKYKTIGDVPPAGLCGSGIIDLVAELLRSGVIDSTGRIPPVSELDGKVSPSILKRIEEDSGGYFFVVAENKRTVNDSRVVISQHDIRQIQLAKGAIRAGINVLMKLIGMKMEELDAIFLAGAFGNCIKVENAVRIGLLPDLKDRIKFVGNTASVGAQMALLNTDFRDEACEISRQTEHIELAVTPDFQKEFMNTMSFPEI